MKRTNKMVTTSKDLDKDVMKELECPVCFEYMKSPISMCENGHSVCSDCKSRLDNCPYCRKPFLQVRNLALESLSTVLFPPDFISKNSDTSKKSYKCPFTSISNEDCSWVGSLQDMKNHIKTSHSYRNYMHRSDGQFNVVLTNLSSERHYRKVVLIADELFYVVWEITDGSFFCAVLYVGSKNKSSKFTYKFSLTAENGRKKISMCFQTRSVVQEMEKVLTHGGCVVLHYNTVLKFLNSDECLSCEFEISPIETASGVDKNQSKSDGSKTVDRDSGCTTVKREFLGEQTSPMKREFLDSRNDTPHGAYRADRRGRNYGQDRFFRASRRGSRDRSVESHFHQESGVRDFRNRGGLPGRHSKMGRSLTDLRDEAQYLDKDTLTAVKLRNAIRLRVNPSFTLSAAKCEPSGQLTKLSALGKSQDKFQASDHKVNSSSSLLTAKGVSSGQLTNVSASEKSQDKFQASDHKVNSSSSLLTAKGMPSGQLTNVSASEKLQDKFQASDHNVNSSSGLTTAKGMPSGQLTNVSASEKSQDKFQASDHKVNSSSSLLTAKGVSSGQLTSVSALRKSQDKFQVNDPKFIPSSILPVAKGMPSDERTNVSELENSQDTVQSIYPKLKSFHQSLVDDYQRTDASPFDTLHDQVQANNPKVSSNASVARYTSSDQSTDLSPNVFPADNRPDTLTSSEETWKCFLCGQFAPKKQTNVYSLLDIAPPGTTWKCKLCCQWRT